MSLQIGIGSGAVGVFQVLLALVVIGILITICGAIFLAPIIWPILRDSQGRRD